MAEIDHDVGYLHGKLESIEGLVSELRTSVNALNATVSGVIEARKAERRTLATVAATLGAVTSFIGHMLWNFILKIKGGS